MGLPNAAIQALQRKLAAVDEIDRANAIDLGFYRAGQEMGLSNDQIKGLAKHACEILDQTAAAQK